MDERLQRAWYLRAHQRLQYQAIGKRLGVSTSRARQLVWKAACERARELGVDWEAQLRMIRGDLRPPR